MSDVSRATRRKVAKDEFSNVMFARVTQGVANTLTFAQIALGVGLFQGVGLLINRIEYAPSDAMVREVVAATDRFALALVTSNRLAGLNLATDPAMIDAIEVVGIAADVARFNLPIVRDFSTLPMGGKLCPANPLFFAIETTGYGAVAFADLQITFQFVELTDAQYLELIQSQFPANV